MLRLLLGSLLAASLFACVDAPATSTTQKLVEREGAIPDEYIVVLAGAPGAAAEPAERAIERLATRHAVTPRHRYSAALRGFSARMSRAEAEALAADPEVELVEANRPVRASAIQSDATWGLDRIDQRSLPLDERYDHTGDGAGVTVYVIDTGLNTTHLEFTGRVLPGVTAIEDGNGFEDCNGHGTHVAGTVAGTVLGVAKLAKIVPVRVLDCEGSGSNAGVVAGIDYVAQNHPARSVANMSLGGGASDATDLAVRNAVASGVTMVVAAGNEAQDACNVSPAREPMAITVGSTTAFDERSDFSNFGSCVDLSAPGSDITSAWIGANNVINTISGTSMASPHVAGAAALFVGANPTATPAQVTAALLASATPGKLSGLNGSPNLLLYTKAAAAPPSGPEVSFAQPMDGAQVGPSFSIAVNATGMNLVKAELKIDGASVATKTMGTITFQVTNLAAGKHSLEVIVTDANGAAGSDTIEVTVAGGFPGGGGGGNNNPPASSDSDEGGCSTGGGPAGLAMALLVLVRRRRRVSAA